MDLTGIIINNNYKLQKKISEGAFSDCYEAVRTDGGPGNYTVRILNDSRVVTNEEDIIRIRHELGVIASLNHPNIMKIYEFGEVFELAYIVMEYARGGKLLSFYKDALPPVGQLVSIILQISRALDTFHKNRIFHGGLNPRRIHICQSETQDGVIVKVKDIGYTHVSEIKDIESFTDDTTDFFEYLSPEQISLKFQMVDQRSDLYSLGIIFYRLATGRLPWTAEQILINLHDEHAIQPERPGSINPQIDPTLDSIILKLMEKNRNERYLNAGALITDLERYLNGERGFVTELSNTGIKTCDRADFAGRDREYRKLKDLCDYAQNGKGSICLLNGESGIGKTRLIEEFKEYARTKDIAIIDCKCSDSKSKDPYGAIRELLNSYIELCNRYPSEQKNKIKETLKSSLGFLGEIILKLNPALKDFLGVFPSISYMEPEQDNIRFYGVASEFFLNIGRLEHPLVIIIDDLQWIDQGSLELLDRITAGMSEIPIMLISAIREDEISKIPCISCFLNKIEERDTSHTVISLEKLGKEEIWSVVSSNLKNSENIKEPISEFIHRECKGNPFFALEIMKKLIDESIIYYDKTIWNYHPVKLDKVVIPSSVTDILVKKISLLNSREIAVLSHASIVGNYFDFDLLSVLFKEIGRSELTAIIENCHQQNIIIRDPNKNGRLRFVHDRLKEALSVYITPEDKKDIHHKIAVALESMHRENTNEIIFDLANHFIESGDSEKTLQYSCPASFKAADAFANNDAQRYFNISLKILESKLQTDEVDSRNLWINAEKGLAKIYLRIGKYDDSIAILNKLIPYTEDYTARALSHSMVSLAYFKKGDWKLCELYAKIGIEELGGSIPMGRKAVILAIFRETFVHFLHVSFPFVFMRKNISSNDKKKILQLVFYETLFYMYSLKNHLKYLWITMKFLNHVERYFGGGEAMVKALYSYGMLLMAIGRFQTARKYIEKSFSMADQLNDPVLTALSNFYLGICFEWQGNFKQAIELYNKSSEQFTGIGNTNGAGFVLNALCCCYLHLAEYNQMISIADRYYDIATSTQNNYLICNSLIYRTTCYIGTGDFDMAMINVRKAYTLSSEMNLLMPLCISNYLIGLIYYYIDDFTSAVSYYEKSIELYEENKFIKYYTYIAYPLFTEALMSLYKLKTDEQHEDKRLLLNKIKKYHKISNRNTEGWVTINNYSLLTSAKFHALTGNNKKAEKLFQKTIRLCSDHGMKFYLARTLYEYGLFLNETGQNSRALREFELAYHISKEIGSSYYIEKLKKILGIKRERNIPSAIQQMVYKKKLTLIDKLSLDISQVTDIENIFNEVLNTVKIITGSQYVVLFIQDENDNIHSFSSPANEGTEDRESLDYAARVFKTGQHIISSPEEVSKNGEYKNTQTVLYIPAISAGNVTGVCALRNNPDSGEFAGDDIKLLTVFMNKIAWSLNYASEFHKKNSSREELKLKVTSTNEEKIKKVISYIEENYMFNISREGLAAFIDSNPDYFGRCFKLFTGMKISEYINKIRIEEAAKMLQNTDRKIIDIALSVGFENLSTFNKSFYKMMNIIPSQYRKNGKVAVKV